MPPSLHPASPPRAAPDSPPRVAARRRPPPNRRRRWLLAVGTAIAALAGFAAVLIDDNPIGSAVSIFLTGRHPDERAAALLSNEDVAILLARSTLMALHDANRTGDYAVFRLLATPQFQQSNSAEQLAAVFAALRARSLDLSVVALQQPEWAVPPAVGTDRLLRLSGTYPIGSEDLRFALAFEALLGAWRLRQIAVGTEPRRTPAAVAAASR